MKFRRVLVVALFGAAVAALSAAPAESHTSPASKTPRSGASRLSTRASVTFKGTIRRGNLSVFAPNGSKVSVGAGARDPRNIKRVVVGMIRNKPAGVYRLKWTIIAADGHFQTGIIRTRLR